MIRAAAATALLALTIPLVEGGLGAANTRQQRRDILLEPHQDCCLHAASALPIACIAYPPSPPSQPRLLLVPEEGLLTALDFLAVAVLPELNKAWILMVAAGGV